MELCAYKYNHEIIKAQQYMLDSNNFVVLSMKTPKDVTTIEVILMTTTHEDKQVLKLAIKDAQDG